MRKVRRCMLCGKADALEDMKWLSRDGATGKAWRPGDEMPMLACAACVTTRQQEVGAAMTREEAEQRAREVGHELGPWCERNVWPEGHYLIAECRTCYARVTFSLDNDDGAHVGPAARSSCRTIMRLMTAPVTELEREGRR